MFAADPVVVATVVGATTVVVVGDDCFAPPLEHAATLRIDMGLQLLERMILPDVGAGPIGAGVDAQHELFERVGERSAEIKKIRQSLKQDAVKALRHVMRAGQRSRTTRTKD